MNVAEDVLSDLAHGHVPNIFAEKGWKADWKHDRTGLVQRVAMKTLLLTTVVVLTRKNKR